MTRNDRVEVTVSRKNRRGGYALLISMSILMLLAGMATMFVNLGSMERNVSRSYVDTVRARMLAESALDFALSSVRGADLNRAWSDPMDGWFFWGEDTNKNFALDGGEDTNGNGRLDMAGLPLDEAPNVSFHKGPGPDTRGISVALDGTYQTDGDVGAVKVVDCASQINVNNFQFGAKLGNPWLQRILNKLGALPEVAAGNVGTDLMAAVAARGGKPFGEKQELIGTVFGGDEDRFNRVAPFLTTSSWVDADTIRIAPGGTQPASSPRSPVNINTASFEVLVAVLDGMSATYQPYNYTSASIQTMVGSPITVTISNAEARVAARHIIDARFTFAGGTARIYDWMHTKMEIVNTIPGLTQAKKDLIYAAINPNTTCKKFNPDKIVVEPDPTVDPSAYTRIDKFDITDGGTEMCFGAMGYYEIEAHGRLFRDNVIVGDYRLRTVARVSEVFRTTTQKQFERYRIWSNSGSGYGNLHDNGNSPVVSVPEYPFRNPSTGLLYKAIGSDQTGGLSNDTTWCADWDGALMLAGMSAYLIGQDSRPLSTTRRSLVASFGRGTLNADIYPRWGRSPGYGYSMWECNMSNSNYYNPAYSITTDSQYYQSWGPGPKKAKKLDTATMPNMVNNGYDIDAYGMYFNFLKRRRFHTYYGDEMPAPEATIEFFAKPEVDIRTWGSSLSNACKQMIMLDWGPAKPPLTNYQIRIFTANGRVFADFFYGSGSTGQHYVLYGDADWAPHTWHHVEVNFSDKVKTAGGDVQEPNAQLFIDGVAATGIGGLGTPISTAGAILPAGPAMKLPAKVQVTGRGNFSYGVDPWLVFGGAQTLSTDNYFSMARGNFIGTLDNLGLHWWRQHDKTFIPKSRYHDPSYRAYSRNISYTGVGSFDSGVYMRRLKEIEDVAAQKGMVTLGTISCTHVHPYHEHIAGGHWGGVTAFGHMSPRVMVEEGGASLFYSFYDGCAGIAIQDPDGSGGFKNHVLRGGGGNKAYFIAEFEVSDTIPVNQTSYLDDFTVTYSTGVQILSRAMILAD